MSDTAIEALRYSEFPNSSDCISRQAAIDVIIEDKICDDSLKIMTAIGGGDKAETLNMTCDRHAKMLMGLPSAQPEYRFDEWCTDCKEYDTERHCCPRFNQVIRTTLDEMKSERKKGRGKWNTYYHSDIDFSYSCNQCGYSAPYQMIGGKVFQKKWNFCPNCGARMTEEDV